jgi:hypothetical protein
MRSIPLGLLLTTLATMTTTATFAASTLADMQARAKASLQVDKNYEAVAAQAIFGDNKVLAVCAPKTGPAPASFAMYVEVLADGKLGETLYSPQTDTTRCVQNQIKGRTFPKPPGKYVVEIKLAFKQ